MPIHLLRRLLQVSLFSQCILDLVDDPNFYLTRTIDPLVQLSSPVPVQLNHKNAIPQGFMLITHHMNDCHCKKLHIQIRILETWGFPWRNCFSIPNSFKEFSSWHLKHSYWFNCNSISCPLKNKCFFAKKYVDYFDCSKYYFSRGFAKDESMLFWITPFGPHLNS